MSSKDGAQGARSIVWGGGRPAMRVPAGGCAEDFVRNGGVALSQRANRLVAHTPPCVARPFGLTVAAPLAMAPSRGRSLDETCVGRRAAGIREGRTPLGCTVYGERAVEHRCPGQCRALVPLAP